MLNNLDMTLSLNDLDCEGQMIEFAYIFLILSFIYGIDSYLDKTSVARQGYE
jgi:hypothetical protein